MNLPPERTRSKSRACPQIPAPCQEPIRAPMTSFLKVFRCGPQRDVGGHEVAAHVDKPRKEEAAGVLDQPVGKVRRPLGQRLPRRCR